jgi:hypothetical protein
MWGVSVPVEMSAFDLAMEVRIAWYEMLGVSEPNGSSRVGLVIDRSVAK